MCVCVCVCVCVNEVDLLVDGAIGMVGKDLVLIPQHRDGLLYIFLNLEEITAHILPYTLDHTWYYNKGTCNPKNKILMILVVTPILSIVFIGRH